VHILYKTTNLINGKYYIGVHGLTNSCYKGSGTALLQAIKKYGTKKFKREVLERFETADEAFSREAEIVTEELVKDQQCYNMKVGGKGGIGQGKSDKHRKNLSKSLNAKYATDPIYRAKAKNGGRKPAMDPKELIELCDRIGKREAAKKLGISCSACQGRYYRLRHKVNK